MIKPLVLASNSRTRRALLENAGVDHVVYPVSIDEESLRESLAEDGVTPRDMADYLAEMKSLRASGSFTGDGIILGCDQILDFQGASLAKAKTISDAKSQLRQLSGQQHRLHSAAVLYEGGKPVWRHVGTTVLHMRQLSPDFIDQYLERNWETVQHSVGGYLIEKEGVRLFSRIDGSHFVIMGLPLLDILSYLALRGILTT